MSELKIFSSEATKTFYEIGKKQKRITENNFDIAENLLLSYDILKQKKEDSIKQLANFLMSCYPKLQFSDKQLRDLSEDPLSFKMRFLSGSPIEFSQQLIVNSSVYLNTLVLNYSVSLEMIRFLLEKKKELENKIVSLESISKNSVIEEKPFFNDPIVEKDVFSEETKVEEEKTEEIETEIEKEFKEQEDFSETEEDEE